MPRLRGSDSASPFSRRFDRGCIVLTALLWWLACAFGIAPLGWIALVPFFYALFEPNRSRRFRFGYVAGIVSFALINWWLIPTIARGAPAIGAPVVVGFFLSLVGVAIIALVHGLQVALVAWGSERKPLVTPLWCALLWTCFDALRGVSVLAHPWGALGFSQTGDGAMLQNAALLGQHGLTFVCAFVAASVAQFARTRAKVHLVAPLVVLALMHGYGFVALDDPNPSPFEGAKVLLVQTDVSSLRKTGNGAGEMPFPQAYRLTARALETSRADLIVWPETTAEFFAPASLAPQQRRRYGGLDWAQLQLLQRGDASLLLGAQGFLGGTAADARLNDAVLVSPGGQAFGRAKERLVPFGERAPFVEWLPFLGVFAPRPQCVPGTNEGPLAWRGGKIAPLVCFESCFPDPAKRLEKEGGDLLVVITNDEWFGGTEAPRQHAAMGVLRAVENRVPLVQCANGGESFVCDAQGRVLARIPFGEAKALEVALP